LDSFKIELHHRATTNRNQRQNPASAATVINGSIQLLLQLLETAEISFCRNALERQGQHLPQLCVRNSNPSDCCNCPYQQFRQLLQHQKTMLLLMTWHVCHVSVSVFIQVQRCKLFESSKSKPFHVFNVQSVKIAFLML